MKIPTVKGLRSELGLSQREMSAVLGVSKKAIQSYEQGWRNVSPHVEQMVLLQAILHGGADFRKATPCWKINLCAPAVRRQCPAYGLRQPGFCWLVTGTMCRGERMGSWRAKRQHCLMCEVLRTLLESGRSSRRQAAGPCASTRRSVIRPD